jgi:hypothetical protein
MTGSFSFLRRWRFGLEVVVSFVEISIVVVVFSTPLVVVVFRLRACIFVAVDFGDLADWIDGRVEGTASLESRSDKDDNSDPLDIGKVRLESIDPELISI